MQNGVELCVDGGYAACGIGCSGGNPCTVGRDCLSGACTLDGTCAYNATCHNGVLDASESDVDCGKACGPTCPARAHCTASSDCGANLLCSSAKMCVSFNCLDSLFTPGLESDVDCGGARYVCACIVVVARCRCRPNAAFLPLSERVVTRVLAVLGRWRWYGCEVVGTCLVVCALLCFLSQLREVRCGANVQLWLRLRLWQLCAWYMHHTRHLRRQRLRVHVSGVQRRLAVLAVHGLRLKRVHQWTVCPAVVQRRCVCHCAV